MSWTVTQLGSVSLVCMIRNFLQMLLRRIMHEKDRLCGICVLRDTTCGLTSNFMEALSVEEA